MALKGSTDRYGGVAITLHWVSALAVLVLLGIGLTAARIDDPVQKAMLLRLHVPLGIFTLALTIVRIVWIFFDRRPAEAGGVPRWQALAARLVHVGLYVLVVLMGTSGLALLILSGAGGVLFFGSGDALPDFGQYPPMLVHLAGGFALMLLIAFHLGAAVYHQVFKKDRLLDRMTFRPNT